MISFRITISHLIVSFIILTLLFSFSVFGQESKGGFHLFILSGQSNMANLNINDSFKPIVEDKFGADRVLIVKDAHHGQPIERWYKENLFGWKSILKFIKDQTLDTRGDSYISLLKKTRTIVGDKRIGTVTFIWMQGERDALSKLGNQYAVSWNGMLQNLSDDLGMEQINFVLGRLSDFDMDNKHYPHWTMIREIQVSLASESLRGAWVDTDGLNGADDNLHYTKDGYILLGNLFADKSIELIQTK